MNRNNDDDKEANARQNANPSSNGGSNASRADVACRSSRAPGSLSTFPDLLNVQNSSNDSNSQSDNISDNSQASNPIHIHSYLSGSIDRSSRTTDAVDVVSQSRQTGAIPKTRKAVLQSIRDSIIPHGSSQDECASSVDTSNHPVSSTASSAASNIPNDVQGSFSADSTLLASQRAKISERQDSSNVPLDLSNHVNLNQIHGQLASIVSMVERANASIDQLYSRVNQRLDSIESRLSSIGLSVEPSTSSSPRILQASGESASASAINLASLLHEQKQDLVRERAALLVGLSDALRVTASSLSKDNEPRKPTSNGQCESTNAHRK